MVKIRDLAKFYSNIGLNYIVVKIEIMKYNHVHQSCFIDISYCDINIINLLRSISHYILCNGSGGGGGVHGVQNLFFPHANIIFDEKRKKEKGEIFMWVFVHITGAFFSMWWAFFLLMGAISKGPFLYVGAFVLLRGEGVGGGGRGGGVTSDGILEMSILKDLFGRA